jgi:hypothetical protein
MFQLRVVSLMMISRVSGDYQQAQRYWSGRNKHSLSRQRSPLITQDDAFLVFFRRSRGHLPKLCDVLAPLENARI